MILSFRPTYLLFHFDSCQSSLNIRNLSAIPCGSISLHFLCYISGLAYRSQISFMVAIKFTFCIYALSLTLLHLRSYSSISLTQNCDLIGIHYREDEVLSDVSLKSRVKNNLHFRRLKKSLSIRSGFVEKVGEDSRSIRPSTRTMTKDRKQMMMNSQKAFLIAFFAAAAVGLATGIGVTCSQYPLFSFAGTYNL